MHGHDDERFLRANRLGGNGARPRVNPTESLVESDARNRAFDRERQLGMVDHRTLGRSEVEVSLGVTPGVLAEPPDCGSPRDPRPGRTAARARPGRRRSACGRGSRPCAPRWRTRRPRGPAPSAGHLRGRAAPGSFPGDPAGSARRRGP